MKGVLMIPIDGRQVCVVPLIGLKCLKCHFPLQLEKNNRISSALLGYHFSNEQC
jgi:hypothetical protein